MTWKIIVVGAGPIGLEFAARAIREGHNVTVLERDRVGGNVERWGHVKLFSPWKLNVSELGLSILDDSGLDAPDLDAFPMGAEFRERYLLPLADWIRTHGRIIENAEVFSLSRGRLLKGESIGGPERAKAPFRVLYRDSSGEEFLLESDVLVDCSGTYGNPNFLGPGGAPALGERTLAPDIEYVIPDVLGVDRERYDGKHTLVVGHGYSAITTLELLVQLADESPTTRITWLTRTDAEPYERVEDDPLPRRDQLARFGNELATGSGQVEYIASAEVERIRRHGEDRFELTLRSAHEQMVIVVDRVVANVGYRPDAGLYRELQVHQCYASEGPMKLAASLLAQSGGADCLAQEAGGPDLLLNPEPRFYVLGMKSYGRNSQFLIRIGLQHIEQVLQLLDREALK